MNGEVGCLEKMNKGIIYYTDNRLTEPLYSLVQEFIKVPGLPITSSSLEPISFGGNTVMEGERSYPTMVNQIVSCLERSSCDYVFFCEHDVLYHPSHFYFMPEKDNIFYYNENVWRWKLGADKAVRHDRMLSLSSLCVNRLFALEHYIKRQKIIRERGWDKFLGGEPTWARKMGYEPGQKKIRRGGITDDDFETWSSEYPNIDVRHSGTFSSPKTDLKSFKHPPRWFKEISVEKIEDWDLKGLFNGS